MARWLRVITALAFAIHVMVGCCMHHAHAEECSHDALPIGNASVREGPALSDEIGHDQPVESDCQGTKCSFVRSANDDVADLLLQCDSTPGVLLSCDIVASDAISSNRPLSQHFFLMGRLLMPIRLHLADQVLLN